MIILQNHCFGKDGNSFNENKAYEWLWYPAGLPIGIWAPKATQGYAKIIGVGTHCLPYQKARIIWNVHKGPDWQDKLWGNFTWRNLMALKKLSKLTYTETCCWFTASEKNNLQNSIYIKIQLPPFTSFMRYHWQIKTICFECIQTANLLYTIIEKWSPSSS
jgi:hypothetical protein